MLKYDEFLIENTIYKLLLESRIEFSKNFINILSSINDDISKDILSLNNTDKDVSQNYIDADLKSLDMVTFIQDTRAKQITKNKEEIYTISDGGKHLKFTNFSSETGREQNTEIYRLLGLDVNSVSKASNNDEVKITGKIISPYDSDKTYCAYQSIKDPSKKCVINIEGLSEKDDTYKKLWTSHRNPIKIGRLIRSFLPFTGKKYTDSDIEKFVNNYKATINVMNDAFSKFDVVSSDKLCHFYHADNYYDTEGTLGNSCMSEVDEVVLKMYWDNPEVCQLVILYSDNGKIVDGKYKSDKIIARALLWTTINGDKFMDRIYTINDSDESLFKKYAERNGWWCKSRQNSCTSFDIEMGAQKKSVGTLKVKLLRSYNDQYPYVDSLSYINSKTGELSNDKYSINANRQLNDTDGGYCYIGDEDDNEDYDNED